MKIKRGDTFAFSGVMPAEFPAGDWSVTCNVQDSAGNTYPLAASLVGGVLSLFAPPEETALWPVGKLTGDVEFTNAATVPPFVTSSKDFSFDVIADRTVTA